MPSMLYVRPRVAACAHAAIVVLSGVIIAACSRSDPALQTAVDSQLAVDSVTATLNLDVSVTRGVVHLAGEVASREQQRRAVEVARAVRGVKDIVDEMHLSDAAIAAAVKRLLREDPVIGKIPIEVVSNNGYTHLGSDQTTKEERARAVEIARKVDGVTQVEDNMR